MSIRHAIWKVGAKPEPLPSSTLVSEQQLEEMIIAAPEILSDQWMLIGRQEITGFGGRIDLLAIAPDGSLILIEIKRDRTPREVVAQALDYAAWVEKLRAEDIAAIFGRFAQGRRLDEEFQQRFGQPLDEETLNQSHEIVIVAGFLDESTERIVAYLNQRAIAINVLCFQVFTQGVEQLLSRAWLIDPAQVQTGASAAKSDEPKEPWNGEFYVSYGEGPSRSGARRERGCGARQRGEFGAVGGTLRRMNLRQEMSLAAANSDANEAPSSAVAHFAAARQPQGGRPRPERTSWVLGCLLSGSR
jgi:hypothetical protein